MYRVSKILFGGNLGKEQKTGCQGIGWPSPTQGAVPAAQTPNPPWRLAILCLPPPPLWLSQSPWEPETCNSASVQGAPARSAQQLLRASSRGQGGQEACWPQVQHCLGRFISRSRSWRHWHSLIWHIFTKALYGLRRPLWKQWCPLLPDNAHHSFTHLIHDLVCVMVDGYWTKIPKQNCLFTVLFLELSLSLEQPGEWSVQSLTPIISWVISKKLCSEHLPNGKELQSAYNLALGTK